VVPLKRRTLVETIENFQEALDGEETE